jgi:peptidoglycan/xylan/chitin deacetylase (PgdA/CDA1 family)
VTVVRRLRRLGPLFLAMVAVAATAGEAASAPVPSSGPAPGAAIAAVVASRPSRPTVGAAAPRPANPASTGRRATPVRLIGGPLAVEASPGARIRIPPGGVPILYYHRVQSVPADFRSWGPARRRRFLAYDSLPAAFEAQLDWLDAHGYTTILPRDLAAHWDTGAPLPRRPVILAFDDGSSTWIHEVLPALRARGMVAEFYLTLDAITHGNLTWRQVRRLARAGNGIGAHDMHHVQLAGVPGHRAASAKRMFGEVNGARRAIAAHIGVAPDSMAYVGGGFDARLVAQVRRAGYTTARSVLRGIHQHVDRRYELRVVRVAAHDDVLNVTTGALVPGLPVFAAKVTGEIRSARRLPRSEAGPADAGLAAR